MQRRYRRPGFTLTELLVVIAIIATLASLGLWGVFALMGRQQARNTETNMKVIKKLLDDRWAGVIADAKKETPSPTVMALAGGDPQRAKVIWIKVRLVEAFPMRYAEVQPSPVAGPLTLVDAYIPAPMQKPYFKKYRSTLTPGGIPKPGGVAGESSACLLMALKGLQAQGVAIDDQIKNAIADSDGDGMAEFIDGWGKPLTFVRFANDANIQATAPSGASGNRHLDPIDTDGRLIQPSWYWMPNPVPPPPYLRDIFEAQFHSVGPAAVQPAGPANANYVIPVIASGGRDGNMGTVNDNIYSYQLQGN